MDQKNLTISEEAKILSKQILDDIEFNKFPISSILMKTNRLARLLRDSDAQKWISYEIGGYPSDLEKFDPKKLGKCQKYFRGDFRLSQGKELYQKFTLPSLEDFIGNTSVQQFPKFQNDVENHVQWTIKFHGSAVQHFEEVKLQVYRYVLEVYLSLSIGDVADDIFQSSRLLADGFIQENCSHEIKEQFLSINDRIKENAPESFSQALLTVRRILMSIADSIFPPQIEPYIGKSGKKHPVGPENYVNRILAFYDDNISSESSINSLESDISHLAARLEALNDKSCKGVHENVLKEEAQLAIIQMYLLIAEIAKVKKGK